jgi:pyruvate-ferredoxin/flavodoxin oxidoreductase
MTDSPLRHHATPKEHAGPRPGAAQQSTWECLDGNEAVAKVAYALSEIAAIYPITPSSPMGELADAWAAAGQPNLWGDIPQVVEMQSEAGAAGALHGALMKGALGTTFTASQGLLLMLPNMYKIAGELTPTVIHVAARTVATHALSIFGDHSDVMAARGTGFAMLAAGSVQESHDLALIAHSASLRSRIPFLHFFDGFRTSHEVNKISVLTADDMGALIDPEALAAHRARGLSPDRPQIRGTAQNPDVFFQAREACNPYYAALRGIVQQAMDTLGERTGRAYRLVEYAGAPDAERVIVLMGSGIGAAEEAVERMVADGEKVGLVKFRLYRPFPTAELVTALPATVKRIAVLDRTKEPGAGAEPLLLDVIAALHDDTAADSPRFTAFPRVIGGRYGLSSKEFTPAMVKGVFDELASPRPRPRFTVGIFDDVTGLSVAPDPDFDTDRASVRAVFYGLGADGTVGANKNSVKIIGEHTDLHAQGYFVYDSKKAGAITVSHLRFDARPIRSTYLIGRAGFVACHQPQFLERMDLLELADEGATFLVNTPHPPDEVWDRMPRELQDAIIAKRLDVHVIDAYKIAQDVGLGSRINTIMQPCFFALAGMLPRDEAIAAIKDSIEKTYAKAGEAVVQRNLQAVDRALGELHRVSIPAAATSTMRLRPPVPEQAPDFVKRVTARMLEGKGDLLPVSALPVDGTFPTGTAQWEKRSIAREIPIWDPAICIDCGKCAIACPHAAIRMKIFKPSERKGAPERFLTKEFKSRELPGYELTIQVAPDDCTGCSVCVDVCPARSKEAANHKAINMRPVEEHADRERANFEFFLQIPELDRALVSHGTVKGSQALQPLFEFSGACAGCGETPYLKLLTQLFGDRMLIANATGCSSIYGGNLPTTPWTTNAQGRGPAWANSLFEDNAEFGLGLRLAHEQQSRAARRLLAQLKDEIGADLAAELEAECATDDGAVAVRREAVGRLKGRLTELLSNGRAILPARRELLVQLREVADELVPRSVWIVGGDGWAYDIGFGGLDHVLASGRKVNIIVLDTEVYSNTGGQASKATPRAAVAKFATAGKTTAKKDLGMIAMAYGNVYVGQIAIGANDQQTVRTLLEAEAWPGPSLILAYSTCIAHGIDMSRSLSHQRDAVKSGYWPLYRFQPAAGDHERPFKLDSAAPTIPLKEFVAKEGRFAMLQRTAPEVAERLLDAAQADIRERWRLYEQLAGVERTIPVDAGSEPPAVKAGTPTGDD